jgi:hypothetical protein
VNEPRTRAGKALDSAWPGTHLNRLDWHEAVVEVERDAHEAAWDRVEQAVREMPTWDKRTVPGGLQLNRASVLTVLANLRGGSDPVPPQSETER